MRHLTALTVAVAAMTMGWSTAAAGETQVEPFGPNWSIAANQPCQVWNYGKKGTI